MEEKHLSKELIYFQKLLGIVKMTKKPYDYEHFKDYTPWERDTKPVLLQLGILAMVLGIMGMFYFKVIRPTEIEDEKLRNQIFGPEGFADKDKNGVIDFSEVVEAYRRMGFTDTFVAGETFPKPRFRELEKAIKYYTSEK